MSKTPQLLVIDNYDSFTYNLVQMFMPYALDIRVKRSDRINIRDIRENPPDYVLISPGPKDPAHAGISTALVREFYRDLPILGVCLGMQCINEAFGGRTLRARMPWHGKTSEIAHAGTHLFSGLPSPFTAARYHSLVVELPQKQAADDEIRITAATPDNIVMGISHCRYPLHGVQFHPESFLTCHGSKLVENFLALGPLAGNLTTH